jgi:hypothetical protein
MVTPADFVDDGKSPPTGAAMKYRPFHQGRAAAAAGASEQVKAQAIAS